jgi:hypothetical protein
MVVVAIHGGGWSGVHMVAICDVWGRGLQCAVAAITSMGSADDGWRQQPWI